MSANENDFPIAQGTATADVPQGDGQQEPVQTELPLGLQEAAPEAQEGRRVPDGVQKRIDELVAQRYERDRRIEEQNRRIDELIRQQNELLARLAMQATASAQRPVEEEDDLAPEDRAKLERYLSKAVKPLEEQIARLTQHIEHQQRQAIEREVDQKLERLGNPAVAAKVDELMRAWANHPLYKNATKQDAYYIALGMLHDQNIDTATRARDEKGRFASTAAQTQVVAGTNGARGRQAPVPAFMNKPVEDMTPEELDQFIAEAEKQNPNGQLL
jgi:hypothetical protein